MAVRTAQYKQANRSQTVSLFQAVRQDRREALEARKAAAARKRATWDARQHIIAAKAVRIEGTSENLETINIYLDAVNLGRNLVATLVNNSWVFAVKR